MANRIPHHFLEAPKETLSVSFSDFATGKGVIELFLGQVSDGNRMSPTAWYGHKIFVRGLSTSGGTDTKVIDEDFDLDFRKNITIEGEAIFQVPAGATSDTDGHAFEQYTIVKVRKWDGTTETDIISKTGDTKTNSLGKDNNLLWMDSLSLTIPKTSFKNGESLRITIESWQKKTSGSGSTQGVLCCDPKGRLVSPLENYEEWDIGTAGREIDFTQHNSPVTICLAQIPVKI